eukprot:symbB.v1.2.001449.t1/scaffold58.1/size370606/18
MAFIFNLFEKSPQNYTGPESQIRHFIDSADVTWLPIGRSKMLEGKSDENKEDTLTSIHSSKAKSRQSSNLVQSHRKLSSNHAGQDRECPGAAEKGFGGALRRCQSSSSEVSSCQANGSQPGRATSSSASARGRRCSNAAAAHLYVLRI